MSVSRRLRENPNNLCARLRWGERNTCDSKGNLRAFGVSSRTTTICALCHHALCAHNPAARIAANSWFASVFWFVCYKAPQFLIYMQNVVIWLISRILLINRSWTKTRSRRTWLHRSFETYEFWISINLLIQHSIPQRFRAPNRTRVTSRVEGSGICQITLN